jgi:hypothetical protein
VRILRSTVMVRVGGGWMALDEFLVKNDPCRGKPTCADCCTIIASAHRLITYIAEFLLVVLLPLLLCLK